MVRKTKEYIRDSRSPTPKDEKTSKVMSSIKGKNTKPEILLREALWRSGVKGYRLHLKELPGKPDIAFTKMKLAIFVNGCFWHRCPNCKLSMPKSNTDFWRHKFDKNVERDKNKINLLKNNTWNVFTVSECQIKNNLNEQVEKIKELINE
jgi:DNA mismatch endonuclease, patch repair protein